MGAARELGETYLEMGKILLASGDPQGNHYLDEARRLFKECGAEQDREKAETTLLRGRIGDADRVAFRPNLSELRITEERST